MARRIHPGGGQGNRVHATFSTARMSDSTSRSRPQPSSSQDPALDRTPVSRPVSEPGFQDDPVRQPIQTAETRETPSQSHRSSGVSFATFETPQRRSSPGSSGAMPASRPRSRTCTARSTPAPPTAPGRPGHRRQAAAGQRRRTGPDPGHRSCGRSGADYSALRFTPIRLL